MINFNTFDFGSSETFAGASRRQFNIKLALEGLIDDMSLEEISDDFLFSNDFGVDHDDLILN